MVQMSTHFKATQACVSLSTDKAKLDRLQRDGIIILIDQANLEMNSKKEKKNNFERVSRVSYGELRKIIARGLEQQERRRVLATYLVTSNQALCYYKPSSRYCEKHKIELVVSPDERTKGGEKGVDCALARIMTQEFEGIEILRLNKKIIPPKRTFCIVSGDFDYVDVVQEAQKYEYNVEIWFWSDSALSRQWQRQNIQGRCHSEGCGHLNFPVGPYAPSLDQFREKLLRHKATPPKNKDTESRQESQLNCFGLEKK